MCCFTHTSSPKLNKITKVITKISRLRIFPPADFCLPWATAFSRFMEQMTRGPGGHRVSKSIKSHRLRSWWGCRERICRRVGEVGRGGGVAKEGRSIPGMTVQRRCGQAGWHVSIIRWKREWGSGVLAPSFLESSTHGRGLEGSSHLGWLTPDLGKHHYGA